jgi:hypothetical protein
VDPRIVGEIISKEWCDTQVVKIKKFLEEDVKGSSTHDKLYRELRKDARAQL